MALTVSELVQNLKDVLLEADGEYVARVYNGVCSDQVVYQGDSLFAHQGVDETLGVSDLVDNIGDVWMEAEGEDIARTYNALCSTPVTYLGDSLFAYVPDEAYVEESTA